MGLFTSFELKILDAIQNIRNPFLDGLMVNISSLGNVGIIWIGFIIIMLGTKEYKTTAKLIIVAFLANLIIVNLLVKNIVDRTRPYELVNNFKLLIPPLSDGSFPSGHSSFAASFASITFFMGKTKLIKYFPLTLAILIAFSRLYLYVHFPSDVISGLVIGFLISAFTMKFYFEGKLKKLNLSFYK